MPVDCGGGSGLDLLRHDLGWSALVDGPGCGCSTADVDG